MAERGFNLFVMILSVILGVYLLNSTFVWLKLPEGVQILDSIILAAAGVVIIFLGIMFGFRRRNYY